MTTFATYIKQIIESSRVKDHKCGWRYGRTKLFGEAVSLFVDFLIDRLIDLGRYKTDSRDAPKSWIEFRHVMSEVLAEYSLLLETYAVEFPINQDAELVLNQELDLRSIQSQNRKGSKTS